MRFWFLIDTSQKTRPDDLGRGLSAHDTQRGAHVELSQEKFKPVHHLLQVVEADYRQVDPNHFLMAPSEQTLQAVAPASAPSSLPKQGRPEGCFLVASNKKNGKVHAVVDHLVYLGKGIRTTNSMLCTGYRYDKQKYSRCDDTQQVTCPRCLGLLHYLSADPT